MLKPHKQGLIIILAWCTPIDACKKPVPTVKPPVATKPPAPAHAQTPIPILPQPAQAPAVILPHSPQATIAAASVVVAPPLEQTAVVEPQPVNKLYLAAKKFDECAMYKILSSDCAASKEQIIQALSYADAQRDAQTTRTLMELLDDSRKSWFERHYRVTNFLLPLGAGFVAGLVVCLVKGPRGSQAVE